MVVRVLSAAVLVALLIVTLWWLPSWATLALAVIAAALGGAELAGLARRVGADVPAAWIAIASGAACAAVGLTANPFAGPTMFMTVMLTTVIAAGALTLASTLPGPQGFGRPAAIMLGAAYVGAPLGVAALLRDVFGPWTLTWIVAVISLSDSAQYFGGRAFGRHKLSPVISPGKTIEGAVIGFVVAIAAGPLLAQYMWPTPLKNLTTTAVVAGLLALAGIVGDLFESLLKRSAGAKDSSALIPGHGGILDRVDAYLFALPMYYLLLRWL